MQHGAPPQVYHRQRREPLIEQCPRATASSTSQHRNKRPRWIEPRMKSCPKCMRVFPTRQVLPRGRKRPAVRQPGADPAGDDPRLGTRLCGRYELRRVVADGGMGRVHEGIDKQTQTRVAVKVLHGDVSKDDVASNASSASTRSRASSRTSTSSRSSTSSDPDAGSGCSSWSSSTARSSVVHPEAREAHRAREAVRGMIRRWPRSV